MKDSILETGASDAQASADQAAAIPALGKALEEATRLINSPGDWMRKIELN